MFAFSCSCKQPKGSPDPAHNSKISLDWDGLYQGVLPCADCESIETSLTLHSNSTYKLVNRYLGKEELDYSFSYGSFSWDRTGSIITLINEDKPNQYFVGENHLIKLDINGQRISGALADHYRLEKSVDNE